MRLTALQARVGRASRRRSTKPMLTPDARKASFCDAREGLSQRSPETSSKTRNQSAQDRMRDSAAVAKLNQDNGLGRSVAETEGFRTLDRALQPYNGLANRRLQPLGHISVRLGHMPDAFALCKRQRGTDFATAALILRSLRAGGIPWALMSARPEASFETRRLAAPLLRMRGVVTLTSRAARTKPCAPPRPS